MKPTVCVVGSGRLGGALARALRDARWPVTGYARTVGSGRRWKRLGIPSVERSNLGQAQLVVLAVPDDVIAATARTLVPSVAPSAAVVHCAGGLPIAVLGARRASRARGSFHPLCAISDPKDALRGHAVAIHADSRALRTTLEQMARALLLLPLRVPERRRSTYHAGAVLAAAGVVATLTAAAEAWRGAGVRERDILRALLPLTRSALNGVERRGFAAGLTGPVVRGDAPRLASHLAALPAGLRPLYRALSLQALAEVKGVLPPSSRRRVQRTLRG